MIYAIDFLHISHQPINWIFCKKNSILTFWFSNFTAQTTNYFL